MGSSSLRTVTIFGPPSSLVKFQKFKGVAHINTIRLPIYAPYHAPHLYSLHDIFSIWNTEPISQWFPPLKGSYILSRTSGEFFQARNLQMVLQNALNDIFLRPMQWDPVVDALASAIVSTKVIGAQIIPISTSAASSLQSALKLKKDIDLNIVSPSLDLSSCLPPHLFDQPCRAPATTRVYSRSKIAIVGMSGRFPGAKDVEAFWDVLYQGLDVHKVVPSLRWDEGTHVDVSGKRKNTSATPYGCWLDEPGLFDARFFGMSPREAIQTDPAQRLALMTVYEALEQAGIVPDATPSTQRDRVGVCYGVTSNDWMETNSAQDIDTYFIPGGNRAFIPGRINYYFKFSGPSYSIDTACSSSLAAIHIACNMLWQNDADTVIAGGTNVLTNPDFTSGLDKGHFLSRTGNCKTFDDDADGYCRGEGVATAVLKRLEDALADNDPIQGVILNVGTNHSAESDSITRPNVEAQKSLFRKVLGGLNATDVSYAEMHGTGTQIGDTTEMLSVLESFAPNQGYRQRAESQPLFIGSVKANVGHGEAAAGITSLIKVLLMMQYNTIPPHCGIKTRINHKFPNDLPARHVQIADKPVRWERFPHHRSPRRALINNFSAAGGNTALLLEDSPERDHEKMSDPRSTHVIAISAKNASSLQANAQRLLSFLRVPRAEPLCLSSLSYTTTARRTHHLHRIAVTGSTITEIATRISHAIEVGTGKNRPIPKSNIAFAFTGQGAHYLGMGKALYDNISSFRADIHRYDVLACRQGFSSIVPIISNNMGQAITHAPLVVQLATTCLQMALVKLWASWGIVPHCVIGHSLGHYAALNAAGVLSEAEAIFLVGIRVQQLQQKCVPETHSMLAVRASISTVAPFIEGTTIEAACINGPEDTVLGGIRKEIEELHSQLASQGIKSVVLKIPYAFHSSQVDHVLDYFETAAQGVTFHKPSIPVICPLNRQVIREHGVFGPKHLVQHYRRRVDMVGALEAATANGLITDHTIFIEIGHHPIVIGMLKATLRTKCVAFPSLGRNLDTWKAQTDALSGLYAAGVDIRWLNYHREFASQQRVLPLPNYNWDLKDYWMKYVNDWSLRKGDPFPTYSNNLPSILSSTIHSIINENIGEEAGSITVQSNLSRPDVHSIVQGHKVNGIPLCTPVSINLKREICAPFISGNPAYRVIVVCLR